MQHSDGTPLAGGQIVVDHRKSPGGSCTTKNWYSDGDKWRTDLIAVSIAHKAKWSNLAISVALILALAAFRRAQLRPSIPLLSSFMSTKLALGWRRKICQPRKILNDRRLRHTPGAPKSSSCCTRHRTASVSLCWQPNLTGACRSTEAGVDGTAPRGPHLPLINRYILNSLLATRKELHS